MKLYAYTFCALTSLITLSANAADIEVMRKYQSNPYKLSQDAPDSRILSVRGEHQQVIELKNRREIRLSGEASHDKLLDLSEGDSTYIRLRGRLVNRYRFGKRSASLLFTTDAGTKRAAYIDQRTAEPLQTSRGDDIRERFSYNFIKPSAEFTYRWNSRLSTGLFIAAEQRDFVEDYKSLNLESLDYLETTIQPTLRYKTESTYSRAYVYARERSYSERMIDDINGRNINGSQLQLSLNGFGVSHSRDVTDAWEVEAFLSGYDVRDNGVGYSNSEAISLSLTSRHKLGESRSLNFDSKCTRRTNDNARMPDSEDIDLGRLREGCRFNTAYEQPIFNQSKNLRLRLEAQRDWEQNTESARSYDQWAFSIGFNYSW